jgi:anti-sigma factor RsiW
MCPDPQLLSIHMDGELPSPWKEKMEAHLTECSECKEKLNNFTHIQELLKKETSLKLTNAEKAEASAEFLFSEHELMEKAKERIWQKLESGHRTSSIRLVHDNRRSGSYNIWKGKVSIPIPAAAAAAVIIALLSVFGLRGGSGDNNNAIAYQPVEPVERVNFVLAAEEEMPGIIPTGDLNSVLQYLGVDRSEIIILQLPESRSFSRSGEPAIIRSADYRRQP